MADELTEKAIELYALYGTPTTVFRDMKAEFGDNSLSASSVKKIREKYRPQILAKRKELTATIPILDIQERWGYLQNIIDGALEGEIIYDKRNGMPLEAKVDRAIALNGIKLANEMANTAGVVNHDDDELIKSIVAEAFDDLKKEKPNVDNGRLLDEIIDSLGEKVRPFVNELREELHVESTIAS